MITTKRLLLRPWHDKDFESFAKLNADPRVMEYFPAPLTRQESDTLASKICMNIEQQGWGFWAVEIPQVADFIGFVGLGSINFDAPFAPAVEVGWRLLYDYWNKGYATEGAQAALRYGFDNLGLNEIIAYTAAQNIRSRHVMEKIDMSHDTADDFDHPRLDEGHPLRRQVLYRMQANHFTQVWADPPENFQPIVEVSACYLEIDGALLVMERAPGPHEGEKWGVPAGKVEAGENPCQAAIRELFEETGIVVSPAQMEELGTLYVQKPGVAYIYHMFRAHVSNKPEVHLSPKEHTQYLWAKPREIEALPLMRGARQTISFYRRKKK